MNPTNPNITTSTTTSNQIPGITPEQRMFDLEMKINKIYESVEKTRKYFLWTMIITVILFVVPLIGLVFAIPSFIGQYSQIGNLTGGF